MTVSYADAEPSGLAEMLGGLVEQNLAAHPSRRRLLRPALVVIEAHDAQVAVALRFRVGSLEVAGAPAPGAPAPEAHLRIGASSSRLLELVRAPLRCGLPDVLQRDGRAVLADIARGRVRISGLLCHPVRLRRLTMVLNVHEGSR